MMPAAAHLLDEPLLTRLEILERSGSRRPCIARRPSVAIRTSEAELELGLVIPNHGIDCMTALNELPPLAEEIGFHSLWVTDHLVGIPEYEPYYGAAWAESLTALSFVAARTTTIRLGLGVLVVPYRDPIFAAKALATIDHLSDGRLDVGLGVGWARSEYEALGAGHHFENRGQVTDESIEIMLRAWKGGPIDWTSPNFRISGIAIEPPTFQLPHPPLYVGGSSQRALKRCARYADVWHPGLRDPAQFRRLGDQLDELAGRKIGRSVRLIVRREELDYLGANLAAFEDAGCGLAVIEVAPDSAFDVRQHRDRLASLVRRFREHD
jgi:probable F420-dependent oxidoreductase